MLDRIRRQRGELERRNRLAADADPERLPEWTGPVPYCPHVPHPAQARFLALECREALYGGASGGGKSDAALMGALQYAEVAGYAALIVRRTYAQLRLKGGLLDRAAEWLRPTAARWNETEKAWRFPGGGSLTFGHLETEGDRFRYQGSEFQYIACDELTQFTETQYLYLFSRLRRLSTSEVPLRMRATSNPGGTGHEWVKARFEPHRPPAERSHPERVFVPARLADNPSLDRAEYEQSLAELDPVTRAQLLSGDWSIRGTVGFFRREWFRIEEQAPRSLRQVRYWDTAQKAKARNDWWAGARGGLFTTGGRRELWITDLARGRWEYPEGKAVVLATARADGPGVVVGIEDSPTGTPVVQDLRRDPTAARLTVQPVRVPGDKPTRAGPWASLAQGGGVVLVSGAWIAPFLDECETFPQKGAHDDQVDAVSGLYALLLRRGGMLDDGTEPGGHDEDDEDAGGIAPRFW